MLCPPGRGSCAAPRIFSVGSSPVAPVITSAPLWADLEWNGAICLWPLHSVWHSLQGGQQCTGRWMCRLCPPVLHSSNSFGETCTVMQPSSQCIHLFLFPLRSVTPGRRILSGGLAELGQDNRTGCGRCAAPAPSALHPNVLPPLPQY
eukprot:Lithocolla_globosa_v1_NODE_10241_length_619_cov_5.185460.p1 type:complete len:148 gc:universal NODE_10241_length_619_cov_5.185460:567-124(-)